MYAHNGAARAEHAVANPARAPPFKEKSWNRNHFSSERRTTKCGKKFYLQLWPLLHVHWLKR